jgi:hypothetical protein
MTTLREAVAVFDDPQQLESAVSALQSSGVDRAYLSFVARELPTETRDRSASRESVVSDTDIRQERVLGTGLAATIAAFAAAGFAVATGGVAIGAIAAVAAAGGVGAASTLVGRKLATADEASLDEQLARGGVLLCVRTPDADTEQRALEVLHRYSARVRMHDLPAAEIPGLDSNLSRNA